MVDSVSPYLPNQPSNILTTACSEITSPLICIIREQSSDYSQETCRTQSEIKNTVQANNRSHIAIEVNTLKSTLPKSKQMSMEQSSEKGASAWPPSLPLAKYSFNMSKQSFRDALSLRFGWTPVRIASHYPCGHPFNESHTFSCSKGALAAYFPSHCHEIHHRSIPHRGLS